MKKMFASLAFAAVTTMAASSVMAATVVSVGDKITLSNGPGDNPGGAFILTNTGPTGTGNLGSFETFCVEYNENFYYGQKLSVNSISDGATKGGVAGQTSTNYDPLDAKTAFLYTNYIETPSALNAVTGWSAATAEQKGTAMQQAIWYIENEITSISGLAQSLYNLALGSGWTDTDRVKVLNLVTYNADGTIKSYNQDQLYLAPVPLPAAGLLMLSALGLGGLMTRRRKATTEA